MNIFITPSAAVTQTQSSSPTQARTAAGTAAKAVLAEGTYPPEGARDVEKAKEHYERLKMAQLVNVYHAKFPLEPISRHTKPELIAEILQKITLPLWSKAELISEAAKYDVKNRGTKEQISVNIVAQLKARGLINSKTRGGATSAPSAPTLSEIGKEVGNVTQVVEEAQLKRKGKEKETQKDQARPSKKQKISDPLPSEDSQRSISVGSQPLHDINPAALAERIKLLGSGPLIATDPANLESECQMRREALELVTMLLQISPNDRAFLLGHLAPHLQHEQANLAAPVWADTHRRALAKRKLKHKQDKAHNRLEQAQAALTECNRQLANLRNASQ